LIWYVESSPRKKKNKKVSFDIDPPHEEARASFLLWFVKHAVPHAPSLIFVHFLLSGKFLMAGGGCRCFALPDGRMPSGCVRFAASDS